jgi:hypothetical protein
LEGLLVGVLLAWLLSRRDKHPLLKTLSAPLRLVLGILDLAWDQALEVVVDLWGVARSWTVGSAGWVLGYACGAYNSLMGRLKSTKDKLSKEDQE